MNRSRSMLIGFLLPMFGLAISVSSAHACAAIGDLKIAIRLEAGGKARALISRYSCAMMPPKSHCVLGIRLSDAALPETKIEIRQVRFVTVKDGTAFQGFAPMPNRRSTAAWGRVMDGEWYGFTAVFKGGDYDKQADLAIEVTFTYDPAASGQQILQAFTKGHVGLAEGDTQGGIARGHMLEVIQIREATLASI